VDGLEDSLSNLNISAFGGRIPENYDRGLGPVLMDPYAQDLATRINVGPGGRVLEMAAGTGILTESLAKRLGETVAITATDLNQGMIEILLKRTAGMNVRAEVTDACNLPYSEATFSALACQFGFMFFPDKVGSLIEARRVLREGGTYYLSVWDSLEHNDYARCLHGIFKEMFTVNPPAFYETPFGFYDVGQITKQLNEAGFDKVKYEHVTKDCTGPSVAAFCKGAIEGNPVILELQSLSDTAAEDASMEFCKRFSTLYGDAPFKAKMQAIVFEATK